MRAIIQRVNRASVEVEQNLIASIDKGLLVFFAVSNSDDEVLLEKFWNKIKKLRIFEDGNGKTNLDLASVNGEILLVSQFTLYADCKRGNRPSFIEAGEPSKASYLFDRLIELAKCDFADKVKSGIFAADMKVSLINDGPFTIVLDSDQLNLVK